jgi:hypothetical protein
MNMPISSGFVLAIALLLGSPCVAELSEFSRDYVRIDEAREEGTKSNFDTLAAELQKKWSASDKRSYGTLMANVLTSWQSAYQNAHAEAPVKQIRTYAQSVLASYDPNKTDNIGIEAEFEVVRLLYTDCPYSRGTRSDQEWEAARRQAPEAWLHTWSRLQKTIDKNWDANDCGQANVWVPGVMPGISPERVADPALRAEYEKAIAANARKAAVYSEQQGARVFVRRFRNQLEIYLTALPWASPESLGLVSSIGRPIASRSLRCGA